MLPINLLCSLVGYHTQDMAKHTLFLWMMLMSVTLSSQGTQEGKPRSLEAILSIWKSKLRHPLPVFSETKLNDVDIKTVLDQISIHFESLWFPPKRTSSFLAVQKNKANQNRLSEFLYNISTYLQNEEPHEQEAETWDKLLHQFLKVPTERSPTIPILKMQDFLVSLRGSPNWSTLLSFIQVIFKSLSNGHNGGQLLGENWEMLSGILDTLFQAFLSGTLTQTGATLQGIFCSLMGHRNCDFHSDQFLKLMLPFEANNWRPIVNVQSGSSVASHGKFRPFSLVSESLKDKTANSSRSNSGPAQEDVQNVLEFIYRSREKGADTKDVDSDRTLENAVWEALEDLRYSLMKKMERSVYDNLNRKVYRMAGTLMNRVTSVIGIPYSDQSGKCSVGNLQQLLLWGIKHNLTWNIQTLGFTSTNFPSAPPILTCGKPAGKAVVTNHNITKRSHSTELWEDSQHYTEVLEAVCNDTIPGLPGVSNFTVFLYCNVYNATGYSVESTYDLHAACSDAAWYISSMEEDSFWVWVCREYFPLEFNITVCKNTSFPKNSQDPTLMNELCTNVYNGSETLREKRNNIRCSDAWQGMSMSPKALKTCLFENKTFLMDKLCSNDSISGMSEHSRPSVSKLCHRLMLKTNTFNTTGSSCNYKAWDKNSFNNITLVEDCKGINMQDFKDLVCRNASLYYSLRSAHPWIVDQCWKNISLDGECFLRRLADVLPLSPSFDSSQLCRNPVSYVIGLVSQLTQCDSESYGWAHNVQYLLKMLDFLFSLSDSDQIGKETRDKLGEAILLTSLLDNSSFWASFKMNSSLSILQTVERYLEKDSNESDKEDLLSCFSPVLWELIQKEENATAFEILLQEYLQMPREGFQKVLMSAENDAVERFLSLMHRSWPRIQVSRPDERGLESLTSMVIQKFPLLTPQIFVDLSQFIQFMSISDIVSFPTSLLFNQSVLDAIRTHSPDMKITQKRAFVKRLLQANMFGDIPSWPPHFLRSIQPLIPHLPICHFVQLSSDQIKLLADDWKDLNLGMIQGRYVAQSLMNRSQDVDKVQRLGNLVCYLTHEDLQHFQPLHYPLGNLERKLLQCITQRTISHRGRMAYSLVNLLKRANIQTLGFNELTDWRSLLPEMGVTFLQTLPRSYVTNLIPQLEASDLSPAQAMLLLTYTTPKSNVAERVICGLHSLLPVLSPDHLRTLSTSLLTRVCQCLKSSLSLMTAAQKAGLMQSLRRLIHDVELWPEQFSCLLPFAPLKLLHLDTQLLLRNMSLYGELAWMPQQTQFLWRKIQAGANLTKNTILTLGTLANGIECDNLQQLSTLSEIRDVVKYLQGIPSGLRKSLRKCIMEEIQKHLELSWEDTGWIGPEFVTDLPVKLIDRLSNDSVKLFLEHVQKYPKGFMELQPYKKSILAERALHILNIPASGEITARDLDLLGPLVGFIGEENISRINRKHLLLHLDELKTYCLSEEFSGHLGQILVEDDMLGHPAQWTQRHIEQIGRLVFYLTPETIIFVPKDVLGPDTLEWLLESQREWEMSEIGNVCTRQSLHQKDKTRKNKMVLTSTLTTHGFRANREPIPSCADMRVTFPSAWSAAQISGMALSEFEGCLRIIAEDLDLSADQAKAALAKVKQLFGPVKTMTLVQILQLGNLITYMTERDLHELDVSDWGIVSFLGRMDSWTTKQMRILVSNILHQSRNGASDLELMELTALGHLLCGMGMEDLRKLSIQEFSQASVFLGRLKLKCTETQMETLTEYLTSNAAFGVVSRWGPEIFTEVGTLAAGLPDIVLSSLIRDQIQAITPDAICLISAPKFAVVFSPAQLSLFTSDQATAVTPEQYEHLSYLQRQAISSAQYEGDVHQDPRGEKNSVMPLAAWNSALYILLLVFLV